MIVQSSETVTLVGGAGLSESVLAQAMRWGNRVIAADGGADHALNQGVIPEAVFGDFDSLSDAAKAQIPETALHHIAEQDSTDFDKALRHIEAPLIIGVGFTGARQDHQLACYNVLVRHPSRRCILLSDDEIVFLVPPALSLNLPISTRFSLFPMGAVEGVSDGLRWPLAGLNFAPDGVIGTSNEVTGPVEIAMTAPKMLAILPRDTLDQVIDSMEQSPTKWQ